MEDNNQFVQTVKTIDDFNDIVNIYIRKWNKPLEPIVQPWFRGQGKHNDALKPSLFRETGKYDEFWMNTVFRNRAKPLGQVPETERKDQWLFLMRHVGLPTRLLDWTEISLIALYFALKDASDNTKKNIQADNKPVVWIIHPLELSRFSCGFHAFPNTWDPNNLGWGYFERAFQQINEPAGDYRTIKKSLNELYKSDYSTDGRERLYSRFYYEYPIAVQPTYYHPRMLAQRSVFTIHGKLKEDFETLLLDTDFVDRKFFKKIMIDAKPDIMLHDLMNLGITEFTIYPDFDGLAGELKSKFYIENVG